MSGCPKCGEYLKAFQGGFIGREVWERLLEHGPREQTTDDDIFYERKNFHGID